MPKNHTDKAKSTNTQKAQKVRAFRHFVSEHTTTFSHIQRRFGHNESSARKFALAFRDLIKLGVFYARFPPTFQTALSKSWPLPSHHTSRSPGKVSLINHVIRDRFAVLIRRNISDVFYNMLLLLLLFFIIWKLLCVEVSCCAFK